MRLCKFHIRSFKGLEDIEFTWDDIVVLIGENNVGKSSVLEALGFYLSGKAINDERYFANGQMDEDHAIALTGTFADLSEDERQHPAVAPYLIGDSFTLRKRYWRGESTAEDPEKAKYEEEYAARAVVETIDGWPDKAGKWDDLAAVFPEETAATKTEVGGGQMTKAHAESIRARVRDAQPGRIGAEEQWIPNPGGGKGWKSNVNSVIPEYILVPAVRDASDDSQSKDASTYGRVLKLVIEQKLMARPEVANLRKALATVADLICPPEGKPECRATAITELENDISTALGRVIDARAKILAVPPDIQPLLIPNTTLKLDDGQSTDVAEQGHGLQRTLIVSLVQVLADWSRKPGDDEAETPAPQCSRSVVFAIEEPEIYMHPQMERKMRDALYDLAQRDGYQVACTTHSPVFLDMAEKHTAIVRLQKGANRQVVALQVEEEIFDEGTRAAQKHNLRMITDFDASVNELFFAKRVVLVEGDTEMAVFPRAARLFGIFADRPHLERDVTFINCHGKWTISLFQQVLNHFSIRYVVFHDSDSDKEDMSASNASIAALCGQFGERHMFEPNFEAALGYDASNKDKPIRAVLHLEGYAKDDNKWVDRSFVDKVYIAYTGSPCPDVKLEISGTTGAVKPWRQAVPR